MEGRNEPSDDVKKMREGEECMKRTEEDKLGDRKSKRGGGRKKQS